MNLSHNLSTLLLTKESLNNELCQGSGTLGLKLIWNCISQNVFVAVGTNVKGSEYLYLSLDFPIFSFGKGLELLFLHQTNWIFLP